METEGENNDVRPSLRVVICQVASELEMKGNLSRMTVEGFPVCLLSNILVDFVLSLSIKCIPISHQRDDTQRT